MKLRIRPSQMMANVAITPIVIIVLVVFCGRSSCRSPVQSYCRKRILSGWINTRLFSTTRWIVSLQNMAIFGVFLVSGSLVVGFVLAVLIDQQVRAESFFRTVYLYPNALSFVVTGLA